MPAILDLTALSRRLREADEDPVSQRAREEVNPYLLETVVPLLERESFPRLTDIDFDAFDQYDPQRLAYYFQELGRRAYRFRTYTEKLCGAAPAWAHTRTFI